MHTARTGSLCAMPRQALSRSHLTKRSQPCFLPKSYAHLVAGTWCGVDPVEAAADVNPRRERHGGDPAWAGAYGFPEANDWLIYDTDAVGRPVSGHDTAGGTHLWPPRGALVCGLWGRPLRCLAPTSCPWPRAVPPVAVSGDIASSPHPTRSDGLEGRRQMQRRVASRQRPKADQRASALRRSGHGPRTCLPDDVGTVR